MSAVTVAGRWLNKLVAPCVRRFSRWPSEVGGTGMVNVSYQGRRSGREVALVVAVRRTESGATIDVMLPDQKRWWRNFLGQRSPITLEAAGERRTGQALAVRDEDGKVQVHVDFD